LANIKGEREMKITNLNRWVLGVEIPIKESKRRRFEFGINYYEIVCCLKDYTSRRLAYIDMWLSVWWPRWNNESKYATETKEMFWEFLKEDEKTTEKIK
jgi:hypothetical protein